MSLIQAGVMRLNMKKRLRDGPLWKISSGEIHRSEGRFRLLECV
jgi:hypothetical protein